MVKKTGEQVFFVRGGVSGWWQRGGREERRERGRDGGLGRRGGVGEIERPGKKRGKKKEKRKSSWEGWGEGRVEGKKEKEKNE